MARASRYSCPKSLSYNIASLGNRLKAKYAPNPDTAASAASKSRRSSVLVNKLILSIGQGGLHVTQPCLNRRPIVRFGAVNVGWLPCGAAWAILRLRRGATLWHLRVHG